MYTFDHFSGMIRDNVRMGAFLEAMRRTITPETVVMDLGAGTGIFTLLACQLGAKHVYSIEPNPLLEVAKLFAADNGFSDRITFIQDMSTRVNLDEKVDVIIADIRGELPLYTGIINSFADAQKRLLNPGGVIIPQRDTLYAAFIDAPDLYRDLVLNPWGENPFQLNLTAGLKFQTNITLSRAHKIQPEQVILPGQVWDTLEYGVRQDPSVQNTLQWTVERAGTAHMINVWFDATIYEDIGFSHAPGSTGALVYGSMLLPLTQPLTLEVGDQVELTLSANYVNHNYIYSWKTIRTRANAASPADRRVVLDQSTFYATPLNNMMKRAGHYVPTLNEDGKVVAFILDRLMQRIPLQQIAGQVKTAFPDRFQSEKEAFTQVTNMSLMYSE